jgi:hypothetical protein
MAKEIDVFVEVTFSSCHFSHYKPNIEYSDIKFAPSSRGRQKTA